MAEVVTNKNQAFVFIKPHAANDDVCALVKSELEKKGIEILAQGEITANKIDADQLIDNHYYAIASKATILKPDQLNVPKEKFAKKFGAEWDAVLAEGLAYNAIDGAAKLGLDAKGLEEEWRKAKKERDACVKFGGGFYCSEISGIYIFNGFFMSMRDKYVAKGKKIIYFSVSWDSDKMDWETFRGSALGPTDPSTAPTDSIRGIIYSDWKKLGLEKQPDTGDNGVHASASPFEGLAERMNWLGAELSEDPYGNTLLDAGVPKEMIMAWAVDPQVVIDTDGNKGSLFDQLEDLNFGQCTTKAALIAKLNA